MDNLPGVDLCLQTDNHGLWDVTFSFWESGGGGKPKSTAEEKKGGGFTYRRCQEVEQTGPMRKKIPMASRGWWASYSDDCGIEYSDLSSPQGLLAACTKAKIERALDDQANETGEGNETGFSVARFSTIFNDAVVQKLAPRIIYLSRWCETDEDCQSGGRHPDRFCALQFPFSKSLVCAMYVQ
jgi:hypothetical protein